MTAFPRRAKANGAPVLRGHLVVPASLAVLLGAATACAGADAREEARRDEPAVMSVHDPYAQADMATLSAASEAVVRGTVTAAEPGLEIDDNIRDGLRYTRFTVEVDEVLGGTAPEQVQVVLSTHLRRQEVAIEGRPVPEVGDEALWFLTPIAPEFGVEGYVLTGQSGLLLLEGGEVTGGGAHDARVHGEVERLGSAAAVVEHVRSVAD